MKLGMLSVYQGRDSETHWEILHSTFAAISFRHRCLSSFFPLPDWDSP